MSTPQRARDVNAQLPRHIARTQNKERQIKVPDEDDWAKYFNFATFSGPGNNLSSPHTEDFGGLRFRDAPQVSAWAEIPTGATAPTTTAPTVTATVKTWTITDGLYVGAVLVLNYLGEGTRVADAHYCFEGPAAQ